MPETPAPKKKKKVLIDSLNDRSDDEDEDRSSPGERDSPIQEDDDEFDRDDDMGVSANVKPTLQLETIEIPPNINI